MSLTTASAICAPRKAGNSPILTRRMAWTPLR